MGKVRGLPATRDLATALKGCDDPACIDFIRKCLDWNPVTRLTPAQALRHRWIRGSPVGSSGGAGGGSGGGGASGVAGGNSLGR